MQIESVGFVGGGRAAKIILSGWQKAGTIPSRVVVADPDRAVLEALAGLVPGIETTDENSAAAAQEVCILSVHPFCGAMDDKLTGLMEKLRPQ